MPYAPVDAGGLQASHDAPHAVAAAPVSGPICAGWNGDDMKLTTMITIALLAMASSASAQNCMQYPPGPVRFDCVSRNNPGAGAKLERCRQQGVQMGLKPRGGAGGRGGGLKEYVQACMQRR
jgi:hypothetical protein